MPGRDGRHGLAAFERIGHGQQGIDMETSQEPTSESAESGLGPIGRFLLKTVIVCAAIIVSG
jgi:hypothetical protein